MDIQQAAPHKQKRSAGAQFFIIIWEQPLKALDRCSTLLLLLRCSVCHLSQQSSATDG